MLTSPVNVAIATNGAALKANTAASDNSARRETPLPNSHQPLSAENVIEPELPSHSPLTSVNAVSATVGNRTVLQELSLNIANMLKIPRRPEENLTALFLRIIARIESMPQAERLQFEVRTGLKPLKITLSDLLMALRKPDGLEAARLTAIAEAPTAIPNRTAANAATTTYLEEGTDSGHTEETLAMRAAARHSAAGQSVFSAESKVRPADAQPTDAKVLQNHLKTMFEAGETAQPAEHEQQNANAQEIATAKGLPVANGQASFGEMNAKPPAEDAVPPALRQPPAPPLANAGEEVHFSSANLNLDPLTVERIRNVAQSLAALAESVRADLQRPTPEKTEDRRLQTMLTLKGLAEVVTAIPAKAAELLAAVVAEAAAPLPELADETSPLPAPIHDSSSGEEQVIDLAHSLDETSREDGVDLAPAEETTAGIQSEETELVAEQSEAQAETAVTEEFTGVMEAEAMPLARTDLAQHGLPFIPAQVQPAREEIILAVEDEETHGDTDEDGDGEDDEDGERRRPRDEYDAIHDELAEEDPVIVITRDSSEADRAFAMYQRMGGF